MFDRLDDLPPNRYDRKERCVPHLKIGIELAGLGLPAKQALKVAADLGADAVELDGRGEFAPRNLSETGLRQLRKMLADLRLQVAAVSFHTRRGYDTPADLDARVEATKAAMRLAAQLGARVGRQPCGPHPPGPGRRGRQPPRRSPHRSGPLWQPCGSLLGGRNRVRTGPRPRSVDGSAPRRYYRRRPESRQSLRRRDSRRQKPSKPWAPGFSMCMRPTASATSPPGVGSKSPWEPVIPISPSSSACSSNMDTRAISRFGLRALTTPELPANALNYLRKM